MLIPHSYEELLQIKGKPLKELGVAGSALVKGDALAAIDVLKGSQVAILGGDVLTFSGGKLSYAKANWYTNRKTNEQLNDFLARSWSESEDYVKSFPDPEDGSILYALVVSELGT